MVNPFGPLWRIPRTSRRLVFPNSHPYLTMLFMKPESPDRQLIALIDRVAQADESALRELYELTSSKLYGVAIRVVTNREWAEDVLQEAF